MYAYIEGIIDEVTESHLVLDHEGIGYELLMPASDLSALSGKREGRIRIYTWFSASENGIFLYGFLEKEEKELFNLLTTVNGVGPKAALSILGTLSCEQLRFAIAGEDAKTISTAPGIGPKTARRIILDLKDKIDFVAAIEEHIASPGSLGSPVRADAIEALVALGYSSAEALKALSGIEVSESETTEELIRLALREL